LELGFTSVERGNGSQVAERKNAPSSGEEINVVSIFSNIAYSLVIRSLFLCLIARMIRLDWPLQAFQRYSVKLAKRMLSSQSTRENTLAPRVRLAD